MNVEKINVNGVELDVCDRQARDVIGNVNTRLNVTEQNVVDMVGRFENLEDYNATTDGLVIEVNGLTDRVDEVESIVSDTSELDELKSDVVSIQETLGDYNTIVEYNKSLSNLASYSRTIYKKNGWVFFKLEMKPATNKTTGYLYTLCTLDEAIRPKSTMKFIDKFYIDGNEYGCELSIDSSGIVEYKLLNNVDTTKSFYFNVSYPSLI